MNDVTNEEPPFLSASVRRIRVVENIVERSFYVSKAILERYAPAYDIQLAQNLPDVVHEVNLNITKLFIEWLDACELRDTSNPRQHSSSFEQLRPIDMFKLYTFAGRNSIWQLRYDMWRHACMVIQDTLENEGSDNDQRFDTVFQGYPDYPPSENAIFSIDDISYIYSHIKDYWLRELLVTAFCAEDNISIGMLMDHPKEFVVEVLVYIRHHSGNKSAKEVAIATLERWSRESMNMEEV